MITIRQADVLVREFYGEKLAECQLEIVAAVLSLDLKRVAILGATQIQKSRAVARALGILAARGVGIIVVGPKLEQAITPLQYFIQLMGYNPYFQSQMLQGGEDKLERLQATEAKTHITFKGGGFIKAVTLNENDNEQRQRSVLGKGAQMVVFEEASLTANVTESLVLRMIAGWGNKGRVIKLGNAITREKGNDHFYRSTQGDDGYHVITIDYKKALAQGIYTPEFIEEVSKKPLFESLYACVFPDPSALIQGGYMRVFSEDVLKRAREGVPSIEGRKPKEIGIDVGEGSPDPTVVVFKDDECAWTVWETPKQESTKKLDVLEQADLYEPLLRPHKTTAVLYIDGIGVGSGVVAYFKKLGYTVRNVRAGEPSPEKGYRDVKAYAYWQLESWLRSNHKLGDGKWSELEEVGYKVNSDKNIYIESKDELRARKVASYNHAEALMLTFAKRTGSYTTGQISTD